MIKLIKLIVKNLLFRPIGLKSIGENSYIALPYSISGKKNISIGNNFNMRKYGHIIAIEEYEGIKFSPNIIIEDNVYIGGNVHIHAIEEVYISEGCVLSEFVYISDISHGLDPLKGPIMKQNLEKKGKVCIGKNTFIGLHSSILPGVKLGKHCVVGTGSVVTKSFPDYSVIAGNPAKIIKKYNPVSKKWIKTDSTGKFIDDA